MDVTHIPIFLTAGDRKPIGFGEIKDDKLVITVVNERIVGQIGRLASTDDIKELYLGVGFAVAKGVMERRHP